MKESGINYTMIQEKNIQARISAWMFYIMIFLTVSMPLSEFGMSSAQFLLFGIWLIEGADFNLPKSDTRNTFRKFMGMIIENITRKFRKLFRNPALLAFLSLYILHIVGIIYTDDMANGLKDLRIKLPLLSLPIIIATSESLTSKRFVSLIIFFCLAVFAGSLASMYVLATRDIGDPRELSVFISHIRFSLQICLAILALLIIVWKKIYDRTWVNFSLLLLAAWLIYFLFILKSMTGIVILGLVTISLVFIWLFKQKYTTVPAIVLITALFVGGWYYIRDIYKEVSTAQRVDFETLDKKTSHGNIYIHDTISYGIEKGKHVGLYIAPGELRDAWNNRSRYDFNGADKKGQSLKYTLVRYLHSKGYRKDAEGVYKLSAQDVAYIENGIANANYIGKVNIRGRVEQSIQGYLSYKKNNNPNASSMMQRFEYWKTSVFLIGKKPVLGYGTGDLAISFEKAYIETDSNLLPEFRHRSHNQFLAITIAFGIVGLFIFLFALFYPPIISNKFFNSLYLVFFLITIISFITEDTLETQAGVTFFAFFSSLFLFGIKNHADDRFRVNFIYRHKAANKN